MGDVEKLGKKEFAEQAAEAKNTVSVRFEGARDLAEPPLHLEIGDHVLPLGKVREVPQEVFDALTSGENERLYQVTRLTKEEAKAEARAQAEGEDEG